MRLTIPTLMKIRLCWANKLDLPEQTALNEFEAEISNARAQEPLPVGNLDFEHYKAIHHHLFQDVYEVKKSERSVLRKAEIRSVFQKILKARQPSCSRNLRLRTILKASMLERLQEGPRTFYPS